jgi:hypothetical protein
MLDWDAPLSEQPESVLNALGYDKAEISSLYDELQKLEGKIDPETFDGSPLQSQISKVESELRKWNQTGEQAYRRLSDQMGNTDDFTARFYGRGTGDYDKQASQRLAELGIPGIKYLDGTSRRAGEGTRNFVVFSDDVVTPLKRNNEPIK